jgi:hypothetical protein
MKHFIFVLALLALPAFVFAEDFVPLTSIPALQGVGNASDLSGFLNGLYRICIGLAATLAILQLVRAGIMYMGGDSVTDKGEAKNLILMSLFGLLLVLSPVIVFGIINPKVLSLEINVSGLQSTIQSTTQQSEQRLANQILQIVRDSAQACGVTLSDPMTNCLSGKLSSSPPDYAGAGTCLSSLTSTQQSCMFTEMARRAGAGIQTISPNERKFTGRPNYYITVGILKPNDRDCKLLYGEQYQTNSTCQSDLSERTSQMSGWGGTMLFRCQRLPSSGEYLITAENMCTDQPYIPS